MDLLIDAAKDAVLFTNRDRVLDLDLGLRGLVCFCARGLVCFCARGLACFCARAHACFCARAHACFYFKLSFIPSIALDSPFRTVQPTGSPSGFFTCCSLELRAQTYKKSPLLKLGIVRAGALRSLSTAAAYCCFAASSNAALSFMP